MVSALVLKAILGILGACILKLFLSPKTKKQASLPPGPKGLPFLGNVNDIPKPGEPEWQHWLKHRDLYGGISSVTIFGQPLIIVNEPALAYELLEKRSTYHSSRPKQHFAGEMYVCANFYFYACCFFFLSCGNEAF